MACRALAGALVHGLQSPGRSPRAWPARPSCMRGLQSPCRSPRAWPAEPLQEPSCMQDLQSPCRSFRAWPARPSQEPSCMQGLQSPHRSFRAWPAQPSCMQGLQSPGRSPRACKACRALTGAHPSHCFSKLQRGKKPLGAGCARHWPGRHGLHLWAMHVPHNAPRNTPMNLPSGGGSTSVNMACSWESDRVKPCTGAVRQLGSSFAIGRP